MERGSTTDTNGARALVADRSARVEAAGLSPMIRDLILRFTAMDGDATLDRSAFVRRPPLPAPEAPPQPS